MLKDPIHHFTRAQILHLVQDETFATHHPALSDMEHLHGGLEVIVGQSDQIEILIALSHHLLFFDDSAYRI
jgi:hypothetical protein